MRKEVWRAFVDAQKEGLIKSIGVRLPLGRNVTKADRQVSNFGAQHIQEFIDQGVPLPVVNQVDLHPFMRHPEIVKICEDNGILLEVCIRC